MGSPEHFQEPCYHLALEAIHVDTCTSEEVSLSLTWEVCVLFCFWGGQSLPLLLWILDWFQALKVGLMLPKKRNPEENGQIQNKQKGVKMIPPNWWPELVLNIWLAEKWAPCYCLSPQGWQVSLLCEKVPLPRSRSIILRKGSPARTSMQSPKTCLQDVRTVFR